MLFYDSWGFLMKILSVSANSRMYYNSENMQ